ncbi:MAG: hypothetical protein R8L07_12420 [Alphaproteobacteria bacterium]|nr:hypothetical protein [Alphaproteobacteria bacterium]
MLLVVLAEAGAAAYLAPVLRAWSETEPGFEWSVVATAVASARLPVEALGARLKHAALNRGEQREAAEWIDRLSATALLCSAGGWPMEHGAVAEARSQHLPVCQFVDTWTNYARRFRADVPGGLRLPDRLLLIDEQGVKEAVAEGIPRSLCATCGHPVWETISELDPTDSRASVFIGAPVYRDYGTELGYTESDSWAMLEKVRRDRPDLISDLLYAPHPEQTDLADIDPNRIRPYHSRQLETEIGQVFGIFSAPLVDAYLSGRRSVSIQPNAVGQDMWPLSRFGFAPRARSEEELIRALEAPLAKASTSLRRGLENSRSRITAWIEEMVSND